MSGFLVAGECNDYDCCRWWPVIVVDDVHTAHGLAAELEAKWDALRPATADDYAIGAERMRALFADNPAELARVSADEWYRRHFADEVAIERATAAMADVDQACDAFASGSVTYVVRQIPRQSGSPRAVKESEE